ncbi:transmembrane protein 45B-like protein [Tanacetum coccineum]|uniref:Transmembrane protein 45B-like protein n=1 Tax=Tanacetum coccineum TaxID=301880 RepID=A0ABQ5G6N5_9ASTR
MQHSVDGRAWKNFNTKYLDFAKEPRIVRLGLAADGFNPFGNLKSSFMMTLLIYGPKSPSKDIDVYLRPLIDDLKDLWSKPGVETIDIATGQKRSLDFNGEIKDGDPPRKFNRDDIMAQLAKLPMRVKDVMHIEKNVLESILNTLLMNDKSKDTTKDDMLKAQSKVVDIMCNLELINPLGFFDIMIYLVIHLPLEALEGSEFPNKDMKEEFPSWFGKQIRQCHVDNNPGVGESSELFALACGPSQTLISVNSCVVNGVSLNDLDFLTLHIDGQSMDVDTPPDIIDVDEDDDIIDDEDVLPYDLADSDDEDLVNVNDDDDIAVTQFDLKPHMESERWPKIYTGIQQYLQKIYNGNKSALKAQHWMESSATREYPSLIHTFFLTHTVNDVFLNLEDKALYEEMLRLQGLGSNTETGVPYTEDEIMAIVRGGKQRGHIPGVGRVLPG